MQLDPLRQYLALRQKLETEKTQLEARLGEITRALGQIVPGAAPAAPVRRGPRRVSRTNRLLLSKLAKARWAAKKTGRSAAKRKAAKRGVQRKGKLSAAGRASIIAAQKARWAKVRAAKAAKVAAVKK